LVIKKDVSLSTLQNDVYPENDLQRWAIHMLRTGVTRPGPDPDTGRPWRVCDMVGEIDPDAGNRSSQEL
jgi:hypothetical protein